MYDLHCHTTASDGTLSAEQLVEMAIAKRFTHLAITDHDSVEGARTARSLCEKAGILFIPAIELSTRYQELPVDILGYGIDLQGEALARTLDRVVAARRNRVPHIIGRLRDVGVTITSDDVDEAASGGVIGRPHIARALVNLGIVSTVAEAFDRYLGRSGPGYVPKEVLTPEEAIGVINESGGVAVLAHPGYIRLDEAEFDTMLRRFIDAGLGGVEAYYSQHAPAEVERYFRIAEDYGLLVTGGSDFHGANKPHIDLGAGPGGEPLPQWIAQGLVRRCGLLGSNS